MPQIKNLVDEALGHIHKCAVSQSEGLCSSRNIQLYRLYLAVILI